MKRSYLHIEFLLLSVLLIPGHLFAGGFNNPDMGPRRNGMFAVTAMPDDTTAVMHNPAGLADQRQNRFYMSGMAARLNLEAELKCEPWMLEYDYNYECYQRSYTLPLKPERTFGVSPFFGASIDLDSLVENLVVGAALYAPNFLGAFMDEHSLARFHGIETLFLTVTGTGAFGYRPNEYVSVGGGISYMYVLYDSWRRYDSYELSGFDLGDEIDMKLQGRDHTTQYHVGLLINPAPWLSVGAGFDSMTPLDVTGDIQFALVDRDDPERYKEEYDSISHQTGLIVPYKLKVGVNIRPTTNVEIGVDYFFWRYSVVEEQVSILSENENTGALGRMVVGIGELRSPAHMNDSHNLCGGIRFFVPQAPFPLWLMTGVQYDWSPGNDKYFSLESPYADIYGMSLGLDSQPLPWLKVGLAWIHNRFAPIDVSESQASPPTNLRASIRNNQVQLALQALF